MAEQNESGWNDGRVTDEPIKSAHYRESGFEEKPLSREEPNNGNREEPNNDSRDRGSPRRSERREYFNASPFSPRLVTVIARLAKRFFFNFHSSPFLLSQ